MSSRPIWKPWGTRYEIGSHGRVRSRATGRVMRQDPTEDGYQRVKLLDEGRRRWFRVHLLVLLTFTGPKPSPAHVGAHSPDNNKKNNRANNLRWSLPTHNEADKYDHGTEPRGVLAPPTPPEKVMSILALAANGKSFRGIAKTHGMHPRSISRLVRKQQRKAS